jgi:hypothetical protein
MRFLSTLVAVAALALVGASSQGAMAPKKTTVPAVIPRTTLFRGWVTVTINGQTFPGYADWRGFPDSVPTNDPTTWVFVGSGSSWRLLSQAELRGATVRLIELADQYNNSMGTAAMMQLRVDREEHERRFRESLGEGDGPEYLDEDSDSEPIRLSGEEAAALFSTFGDEDKR